MLQSVQSWSTSTLCLHSSAWEKSLLMIVKLVLLKTDKNSDFYLSWWRTIDTEGEGKTSHPILQFRGLVGNRTQVKVSRLLLLFLYLVIGSLETVVENVQNMGKLSLKCANAFQVLRHLQKKLNKWLWLKKFQLKSYLLSSPIVSTPGLKLLQLFPQLFFIG